MKGILSSIWRLNLSIYKFKRLKQDLWQRSYEVRSIKSGKRKSAICSYVLILLIKANGIGELVRFSSPIVCTHCEYTGLCQWAFRTGWCNRSMRNSFHSHEERIDASRDPVCPSFLTTGATCRRSPNPTTSFPPNGLIFPISSGNSIFVHSIATRFDIGSSFQHYIFTFRRNWAWSEFSLICDCSSIWFYIWYNNAYIVS